jgi:alanine racemase
MPLTNEASPVSQIPSLPPHITGVLEISTRSILQNYRTLQTHVPKSICAAVLKADAYGFGIKEIAPLLYQNGCRHYFVAHIDEGLFLRNILKDASIFVLSGILPETEEFFIQSSLIPILTDFGMVEKWVAASKKHGQKLPCGLHMDTGMHRSGFDQSDVTKLLESFHLIDSLEVTCVMSHLVSSHAANDPLNNQQKNLFDQFRQHFPHVKASLADTGGIYLDPSFHYDIVRPGKGLFGLFSPPSSATPLIPCLKVLGRILQIRSAHKGDSVGYGATHILDRDSKLATLGVGFADGYDRRLSNQAFVEIQDFQAPVVGRISMDYTVVDVTDVPESLCYVGGWVELVNETITLDTLAHLTGTISREFSTGFGKRFHRIYV